MAWSAAAIADILRQGSPPEDALHNLQCLATLGKPTDAAAITAKLQAIFMHPSHLTLPFPPAIAWLVAFMVRRHPQPHPHEPLWLNTFYTTQHPLYTWTPEEVQRRVRCHSPTKAAGDPFADAFKELTWPRERPEDGCERSGPRCTSSPPLSVSPHSTDTLPALRHLLGRRQPLTRSCHTQNTPIPYHRTENLDARYSPRRFPRTLPPQPPPLGPVPPPRPHTLHWQCVHGPVDQRGPAVRPLLRLLHLRRAHGRGARDGALCP